MKKLFFSLTIILCIGIVSAQSTEYLQKMKENISLMDSAKNKNDWQILSNNFERYSAIETTDWLPLYYTSFCNLMISMFCEKDKEKDSFLEKSMNLIDKQLSLNNNNSEIYILKAFIIQMQIAVKPSSRGRKLGPAGDEALNKAYELNPENPRYYILKADNLYYTPAMFGGDKKKAKEFYQKAINKFETFTPETEISPNWGLQRTKAMLVECEK